MGEFRFSLIVPSDSATPGPSEIRQYSTWAILAIAGLGTFITALDQTVVVTALPSVMLDLKIPITQLDRVSWIITAYLLGYTVVMPLIGRLGDVYGYPRVYQASLVVFCIGTSLVALAQSFEFMIGARVIQAIGGGATVPLGMASGHLPRTSREAGPGPRRGGRRCGGRLHARPRLRRRNRRAFQLALDLLAQCSAERDRLRRPDAAAQPALPGRAG